MRKILFFAAFIASPVTAFSGEKAPDVERLAASGVLAANAGNIEDAKGKAALIIDGGALVNDAAPVVVPGGQADEKNDLPQIVKNARLSRVPDVLSRLSVNGPADKAVAVVSTVISMVTLAMVSAAFGGMFGAGAALGAVAGAVAALIIGICIWAFRVK